MPIIDQTSAAAFVGAMAPDWCWLLQHIESEQGYVRFPPLFSQLIRNLNIGNYPELYENEAGIGIMMLRAFVDPEDIKGLDAELLSMTPEERSAFLSEFVDGLKAAGDAIELPKTPAAQRRAEAAFNAMSPEEQKQSVQFLQRFMMAFLASFYQSLSIMVHGEKLTALVARAKAGDDKAFAKAVQIDKRILLAVPYFRDRFADASSQGNQVFTEDIGARLVRPPYRGKIRHKSLYLAFAFLDMVGLLQTMKHREILDLCSDAGLDTHANRIDDVKNLSKRLAEFRAFQRRGVVMSTP